MSFRGFFKSGFFVALLVAVAVTGTVLGQGGPRRPDPRGPIKPRIDDTIHGSLFADNWFVLFVNGKLVAVDPIDFLPHNIVSIDILPEYPMTIAVMAKDNADPATGMEYGDQIGDGGFILKFADGTVTDATWKAKSFFTGPLPAAAGAPRVKVEEIPANWFAVDFDDSQWPNARIYTAAQVGPPDEFYRTDFQGAQFIWSEDLFLDNTVIFRKRIERPGWQPRWTTHPDLDIRGAPFK
jgi:hypothetical protein